MQSEVKQAMLQTSGHVVLPEFLPESLREAAPPPALADGEGGVDLQAIIAGLLHSGEPGVYDKVLSAVERILLSRVLAHTHGNQSQAGPAGTPDASRQADADAKSGAPFQEQDAKRRLGNFEGAGEHAYQQPGGKNDANR